MRAQLIEKYKCGGGDEETPTVIVGGAEIVVDSAKNHKLARLMDIASFVDGEPSIEKCRQKYAAEYRNLAGETVHRSYEKALTAILSTYGAVEQLGAIYDDVNILMLMLAKSFSRASPQAAKSSFSMSEFHPIPAGEHLYIPQILEYAARDLAEFLGGIRVNGAPIFPSLPEIPPRSDAEIRNKDLILAALKSDSRDGYIELAKSIAREEEKIIGVIEMGEAWHVEIIKYLIHLRAEISTFLGKI